ncbi:hypothetical protein D3W54_14640 [Komagataeibacter medellinensis]|uniref:Uncharacterized protein n=1 Tax=Komagataeibacter medellinensis TaxID=1177712 RepID=A0ABQ6VR50_9PROT|nr:hypothetical protein [Komagataeibacter medellinensis]KAB8122426.1 hypothetical protein D3W54_14640 [Komagataeibacter medellinensis]
MRSREEQIADLTNLFGEEGIFSFVDDRDAATKHILEAEQRAEQRVRAAIARDSERLDWLENVAVNAEDVNIHCLMNTSGDTVFGVCGSGDYEPTLRDAIDAAREAQG